LHKKSSEPKLVLTVSRFKSLILIHSVITPFLLFILLKFSPSFTDSNVVSLISSLLYKQILKFGSLKLINNFENFNGLAGDLILLVFKDNWNFAGVFIRVSLLLNLTLHETIIL